MKITKEEVLKLGQISMIHISDSEIPSLIERLESLLNYVCCLKELSSQRSLKEMPHNINTLREDSVQQVNPTPIIKLAPESESNYFVVPAILKDHK